MCGGLSTDIFPIGKVGTKNCKRHQKLIYIVQKAIQSNTLRRWSKYLLQETVIFNFSELSFRSAATFKENGMGIDIEEILRKACWLKSFTKRK